ncbi:uncharacterized protein LOC113343413 [Papaver somniferum]|uniref:uncharacterized protein LOC113343413 n=1 Tax=Papaver somniferum TaxID=3469 RepID=UPI000E701E12|nr:uncharacterized protein LOC113343413 [Papaver somniferum]
MGDFNCVLRQDEKKGGREVRVSCINEFSDWMEDNDLCEADSLGSKFTWTNGQSGVSRILSKLDRAIINETWLKEAIKLWNQTVFGNVNARLKQDQLKFEVACRNSDEDPFNTSKLNIMKDSLVAVQDVHMQHLTMLKQKARNRWILEGSSNTSFFHSNINIRRSANTISELVTEDGVTISEPIQLRDHVVSYYESKFNGVELPIEDNLFDYEHESISLIDRQMLDAIPSLDEIKSEVFDLGADSAPGPDGFSGCFYRHCWDIIQQDLHSAIVHAWTSKSIPKGSNSSLIILIAKVRGADSLRKYRPIGLSNFFFKIFTKILATRLGRVLDKLVSEEQVAFMKGRNIHENISLASGMVNELHIKRKDGNLGLKLDIS